MTIEAGLWLIVTYALFVSPEKHISARPVIGFQILLTWTLVSSNMSIRWAWRKDHTGGAGALISLIPLVFPSLNVLLPLVGLFSFLSNDRCID